MAANKTHATNESVKEYLASIEDETQRADSLVLLKMMEEITKVKPKLWSNGIIGFGEVSYKSERSACAGEWFKLGFAPRKGKLSIALMCDMKANAPLFEELGKHKTGAGCLYVNQLADVHIPTLKKLLVVGFKTRMPGQIGN